MSALTCRRCLEGRCIRCEAKGSCACSICGTGYLPVARRLKGSRRSHNGKGGTHPTQATQKVGHLKGRHALAGYSSLSDSDQRTIAELLEQRVSISEISRTVGCSRDQVRTIRNRAEGVTHREKKNA